MLLGVIADDFTGASDIANTLVKGLDGRGGINTSLFLGVPKEPVSIRADAGVVALKSRSIPVKDAVEQSLEAMHWLKSQGVRQIVFKYCSTFDSTPEGNIGPVAEALADALGVGGVVVCPAFPTAGRTVYQGHLFVNDHLLSESGLENHPLNPMTDSDIRRWLGLQSTVTIGHLPLDIVRSGSNSISSGLAKASNNNEMLVVVDAINDSDLINIGQALSGASLITGGSGIAIGLPENFKKAGLVNSEAVTHQPVCGPEAILVGSCSGATRRQIDVHSKHHPVMRIEVDEVMENRIQASHLVNFISENQGNAPLVYSSGSPDVVKELQERFGREKIASMLDGLFAQTSKSLVDAGLKRLVVAGGETSGAVVSALNPGTLLVGQEIDPGVPVLYSTGNNNYGLVLKSGNFGADDFFEKSLKVISGDG